MAISRQERKKKRLLAEKNEVAVKKKAHFDKQIGFIKHGRQQVNIEPANRKSIPRKSISVRLPEPIFNDLEYMAFQKGITRSELILLALDAYIRNPSYLPTGDYQSQFE